MNLEEKTLAEKIVYDGKIIKLNVDDIVLPDGNNAKREIVHHSGGAGILCVKDGYVLLVKQFRYAYKKCIWEIPAGKINRGEDAITTAKRELQEECGFIAENLQLLNEIYPTPGYTDEVISLFKATGLTQCDAKPDEDEFLESKWFTIDQAKEMIKTGEIKDAKTLIALYQII